MSSIDTVRQTEIAKRLLKGRRDATCNCGGPQDRTGHAPDCQQVLAEEDAWAEAKEIMWEEDQEPEGRPRGKEHYFEDFPEDLHD